MNSAHTNIGGFTDTSAYKYLQNSIFSDLPSDLQSVIKTVNKKTSAGNRSTTINTNAMKLFLFSEIEIFGSKPGSYDFSVPGEGSQYSYFVTRSANQNKTAGKRKRQYGILVATFTKKG